MAEYYTEINNLIENKACSLLNSGTSDFYLIERNNEDNVGAIDLRVLDSQKNLIGTIDVQYSMNFERFGDVRIDWMSAGELKINSDKSIPELNQEIEDSENRMEKFHEIVNIRKLGKYFIDDNSDMLGVFYFFYNQSFDKDVNNFKNRRIDFCFFLPTSVVLNEIENNPEIDIKINDKKKNKLNDIHHSAFICLKVDYLCEKYNLPIFNSQQDFLKNFCPFFHSLLG